MAPLLLNWVRIAIIDISDDFQELQPPDNTSGGLFLLANNIECSLLFFKYPSVSIINGQRSLLLFHAVPRPPMLFRTPFHSHNLSGRLNAIATLLIELDGSGYAVDPFLLFAKILIDVS